MLSVEERHETECPRPCLVICRDALGMQKPLRMFLPQDKKKITRSAHLCWVYGGGDAPGGGAESRLCVGVAVRQYSCQLSANRITRHMLVCSELPISGSSSVGDQISV